MQGLHLIPYFHALPVASQFCCLSPVFLCLSIHALASPAWVTRYRLLAKKCVEWDSVESPKGRAKWSTRVQGAEDSVGCLVSVLQLPPNSWATESPPATWHSPVTLGGL